MHTHDRVLPHLQSGNAGGNDDKRIERCQNDDKTVLEMDVPQVSLKLVFRGQERPASSVDRFHFGHQQIQGRRAARPRFDQGGRDRSTAVSHLQRLAGTDPIPDPGRQASQFRRHDP